MKEFYEKYWEQRKKSGWRRRYPIFANWIGPGRASVLDLGCGDGRLLQYLKEKNNRLEVLGIDISQTAVEMCQKRGVPAKAADIGQKLPFENQSFDFVIISEVLEHLPNSEELLLESKRLGRAAVLISLPNIAQWHHRFSLFFLGKFPRQWLLEPKEHLRFFSVTDFKKLVQQSGFTIKAIKASSGTRLLKNIWPNLFADQICYYLIPNL